MLVALKRSFLHSRLKKRTVDRPSLEVLESKHQQDLPHFNDSSYFGCFGENGDSLITRLAFRADKAHEHWLRIRVGGREARLIPSPGDEGDGFRLGNLCYENLDLGKIWRITWEGPVSTKEGLVEASFDLTWEANTPLVNFRDAKDDKILADILARQKWSRAWFEKLREIQQEHLEQTGRVRGSITLDGNRTDVDWPSVRDHSFGRRNWATMKRHMWFLGSLEDGRSVNVSRAHYTFVPELLAGYISGPGVDGPSLAVVESDTLAQLLPNGTPRPLEVDFKTNDGAKHHMSFDWESEHTFSMDAGDYFITEKMARIEVDGVPGRGVTEFGLNPNHFPEACAPFLDCENFD